jgi:hypothetical protein
MNELTATVKKAKSVAERKAAINAAIESRRGEMKVTGGARKPIKAALARGVRMIENTLNGGDSLCYLQMTTDEATNCLSSLRISVQKLAGILAGEATGT